MANELQSFLERVQEIFGLKTPAERTEALQELDGRILNQAAQDLVGQLDAAQRKQYAELTNKSKNSQEAADFLFAALPKEKIGVGFAKATENVVADYLKAILAKATAEQKEKLKMLLPEFAAFLKPHVR